MQDKEERARIVNALGRHAFSQIKEGEELRVYDVRTDSFWFVTRKDDRLAWREDHTMGEGHGLR